MGPPKLVFLDLILGPGLTADFGKRETLGIYFYIYCGIYGEI
jgi:hypothetical protein